MFRIEMYWELLSWLKVLCKPLTLTLLKGKEVLKELLSFYVKIKYPSQGYWHGKVLLALQSKKMLAIQTLREANGILAGMKCNRLARQIEICASKIDIAGWQDFCRSLM